MKKFEKVFRKGRKHYLKGHRIIAKAYRICMRVFYQCDIPLSTDIAEDVYFCHNAFGVVINPNAVIHAGG